MKSAIFLLISMVCASPAIAEQSLGVASVAVGDDDQTRPLNLSLWYPSIGGAQEEVGANAVFTGVVAGRDAVRPEGQLPVVFVSHGGLRSTGDSGAWLTAGLARAGYLAVEINAPRPASAAVGVDEIWRRPDDVSRALDALLGDPTWSEHIDQSRISVVGFALGGTAALALGGGTFDADAFVQSCSDAAQGPDCWWYDAQNVALETVDRDGLTAARRDTRIGAVVAIAPEYLDVFSGGLSSVAVPTLVVTLGPDNAAQTTGFAQAQFPDANLFDGFQTCTPAGPAILAEDGGDPELCGVSSVTRQQTHDAITDDIVTFLGTLYQ